MLSFKQGFSTLCLSSHLSSFSVRGAIHTSYVQKKGILCLILLSPTPSPLLSCLPSHLSSSSVSCAIHTSYMKRNSIVISFSSPNPPPHFPSPTTHLSSLPYEKRIINQLSAISLLIWSDCWPCLLWFIYYRTSNVIRSWGRTRHFYPSKSEIYSSCVLLPVFLP